MIGRLVGPCRTGRLTAVVLFFISFVGLLVCVCVCMCVCVGWLVG